MSAGVEHLRITTRLAISGIPREVLLSLPFSPRSLPTGYSGIRLAQQRRQELSSRGDPNSHLWFADIIKACLNIGMYQRLCRSFAIMSSSISLPWLCITWCYPDRGQPFHDTNSTRLELGCILHRSAFTISSEAAKLADLPRIGSLSVLTATNLPPGLQDSWRARQGEQPLTP